MRLSEAFDAYIKNQVLARNKSQSTFNLYNQTKKAVVGFFGDVKISKIKENDIVEFSNALLYTKKVNGVRHKSTTTRRAIYNLKVVLAYFEKRGYKTIDTDLIPLPEAKQSEPRWLEKPEVDKFIEAVAQPKRGYAKINRLRNELIVEMLFVTGLRVSELVALNRDSIHNLEFVVSGKSKDLRPCYITESIQTKIDEYLSLRNDDNEALFVAHQGAHGRLTTSSVRLIFRRACRQSGLAGVHPHTLRHSFGTYLLSNGANIRQVASMMGHRSITTTQRYTHLKNTELKQLHSRIMA